MTTPEARARQNIDAQLAACGWIVQGRASLNFSAVAEQANACALGSPRASAGRSLP
jgi:hypothetical protein